MAGQCWKVVGGADKGGILVRDGSKTTSKALDDRLATGAVVEELELQGERLSYKKLSGDGPEVGWVSVKLKGKELLEKVDSAADSAALTVADEATEAAEKEPEEDLPEFIEEDPEMPPPANYEGGPLPKMPRDPDSGALPTFGDLPASVQKKYKDKHAKKKDKLQPRLRLFIFYGVADSVTDWMDFLMGAPLWVEAAVYEYKYHGTREGTFETSVEERSEDAWEAIEPALRQHAKGGCIEGAPFTLLAHSSGCQLLILLARRMRQKLNLEPCHVFIVDRPPPSTRTLSDVGYRTLCKDNIEFFKAFQPDIVNYIRNSDKNEIAAKHATRWSEGMRIAHEFRCREAAHSFRCPLTVFIAQQLYELDKVFKSEGASWDEQRKKDHYKRCLVVNSAPESCSEWDEKDYKHWAKWTTGPCEFKPIAGANHVTVRFHDEDTIWAVLKEIVYAAPQPKSQEN